MINYYLKQSKMFGLLLSSILFTGLAFGDPTDGCDLEENQFFLTQGGDALYNSSEDIAGF